MMEDRDWLASLKAGDEVALFSGYVNSVPEIRRVDRVTNTLVIVGNGRYRKSDGYVPGTSGFHRSRITQPTQQNRDLAEEKRLRERLESVVKSRDTTLATLRAMYAATKEPQA